MILRQLVNDDLGCASYLVGDERARVAAAVDPPYAIGGLLEEAERCGVEIVRVLETHTHADHVSGHGRLALEHGIPVSIHASAEAEYPNDALQDGDVLAIGDVRVRVLHTPGHRPEHCAFVVADEAVLTGDSLLVGGVGRPDLAVEAHEGARALHASLRRLGALPDGTRVLPGHVAGSLCGAGLRCARTSTVGAERRANPALALADPDDFALEVGAAQPPRPPNMERIVDLNRGPFVGAPPPLATVDAADGAAVLDVRPPAEFGAGHVPGAVNVPVDGSDFASRAGFVLPAGARVALHAGSDEEADRAALGLRAVGFLDLERLAPRDARERLEPVCLDELERLLGDGSAEVIDVREAEERDRGYIAGTRHIPYRLVRQAVEQDLCGRGPVVTICQTGARAAIAASVLAAAGVDARPVLAGGVPDWRGQLVGFRRCGG
jgi:glyoxylase-like metal-dependent hydrolase (beta-lactamase superfamily II)/rhodanese-related sulfurtransferase